MSPIRLEDVFKTCFQDIFKTCLQDVFKTCLQDVFSVNFSSSRCLARCLQRRLQDVFKMSSQVVFRICLEDFFKTSWRPTNVCWDRILWNSAAELRLEDEYNYKNYLLMTSENFLKIFQLIKNDITKENTKMKDPMPLKLRFATTISFLSRELHKSYVCEYCFFHSIMNSSTFTSFRSFFFSIFSSLITSLIFLLSTETS